MKTKTALFLLAIVLAVALVSCKAGDPAVINVKPVSEYADESRGLYLHTLDNGLRVVVKENHVAPVVHVYLVVSTGSMHEEEYLGCGMSHIFEHVMSGGTTIHRTEEETKKFLQSIGAAGNAYTTCYCTAYHMTTTARYLDQALDVISDYMMYCTFDKKELEREFGVILQEIAKGEEEPNRIMWKLFLKTAYDVHPIRCPVIGYREKFLRLNREDIIKYYNRRYVPRNMILAIGGAVDAKKALEKAEEFFGGFEDRPLKKVVLAREPKKTGGRYAEGEAAIRMAILRMGFRSTDLFHPDMVKTDMLSAILGAGKSSRLYRRLVEEEGLVEDIGSGNWTPEYVHGHLIVHSTLKVENLDAARKEIMDVMEDLKKNLVKQEELDRVRTYLRAQRLMYRQTAEREVQGIAGDVRSTGDPLFDTRYLKAMDGVTPEMVRDMARKYLNEDNLTTVVLKPKTETGPENELPPLDVKKKESGIIKYTLKNGLTVLLKRNPELPLVSMQTYSRGGVLFDGDKPGLSNFTANMLMRGTSGKNAEELVNALESMGAEMKPIAGNNTFGMEMTLLREDLEPGLDLFADVLLRPAFDKKEVERVRKNILFGIDNLSNNWIEEINYNFRETRFGNHPYANHKLGNEESVGKISSKDLKDFHEKYFVGSNTVLAIFGDIDIEKTKALVEQKFGAMHGGVVDHKDVAPPPPIGKGTKGVESPVVVPVGRKSVSVILATNGLPIGDESGPDMNILRLMFGSRLHEALRGRNDYVYVVWAYNWPGFDTGSFLILVQTTPDKYDAVIREIRSEIEKMKKGEFTDEELENAKRRAISYVELGSQTNANQADVAALNELYDIGCDYMAEYPPRLVKVSRDDIMKLVNRCFGEWMTVETRPVETPEKTGPAAE